MKADDQLSLFKPTIKADKDITTEIHAHCDNHPSRNAKWYLPGKSPNPSVLYCDECKDKYESN